MELCLKKEVIRKAVAIIMVAFCMMQYLSGLEVNAGTIISETFEWVSARYIQQACKDYPFTITGPGILQVRSTMKPFYCVQYPMRSDGIFKIESLWQYDWKQVKNESLWDGKPLKSYNVASACYLEGKIKLSTGIEEYEIPAKTYSGKITVCKPLYCNANDCSQRGAALRLEVKFLSGQTGPTNDKVPGDFTSDQSSPGGEKQQSSILGSWSVGAIVNGRNQSPHHAPWIFYENGTVEAPGYWKGKWWISDNKIEMEITHQGVTSRFSIIVNPDGKGFTAYENGVAFRHGTKVK